MLRALCVTAALAAVVGSSWADDPKPAAGPTTDELAKSLVTRVARVQDGDLVLIGGRAADAELLEGLLIECNKVGAEGLVALAPTDAAYRRLVTDVPAKFDKRPLALMGKLADTVTVAFTVESTDSGTTADLPPERVQARSEAKQATMDRMLKRNVRQVYIGNGVYPTDTRAAELGVPKAELAALFRAGLAADPATIAANGAKLKEKLTAGKEVRIVCPHGTDLTLSAAKRPVFVTDGVISDEKRNAGGAACQVWLPAGETYLVPVAGTGTGRVVVPRALWEGKEINDLKVTFKDGKVESMTAKPGLGFDRLQAAYKAAGPGKDELSSLDIGVNPNVKLPTKAKNGLYMAAGVVTISIGSNIWAGGENRCPFGDSMYVRDATLTVDGTELIKDGDLKLK